MPELHELLGDLISTTHRLTRLAAQAYPNSESPAVWRTLSVLTSMGPMRLGELAKHSRVSQPTMTKIVRNLDSVDWIRRVADTDDARAWQIAAAPLGEQALTEWRSRLADVLVPYFEGLDAIDLHSMQRAIQIIQERIAVRPESASRSGSASASESVPDDGAGA
ncbi:MarR family winged helix-turn-helix transcriptional regulator [Compostimonas suwonensis]|uniref:MarR family winged helix-turn-helix transcriptional regulator n=1 Tax=Compostimonas suwonensis TaxID=1048394 RepID=UPI001FE86B36|nr:MarR family winged helix-turn-helix transcriptional regulator [Compostimonas suwonensis]